MGDYKCPSFNNCQLVKTNLIVSDFKVREDYISSYCLKDKKHWSTCKRHITKAQLNFCPNFVLPDTSLTPEEIIEKIDTEIF